MDGYFPSELQNRYPDGIPLQVSGAKTLFVSSLEEIALLLIKKNCSGFFHQSAECSPQQIKFLNKAHMQLNSVHVCVGERVAGSTPARAVTGNK